MTEERVQNNELTDEQIQKISDTVEDVYKDSPTDKAMKKAEEAAKIEQALETATVKMVSNPITGKPVMVEEDDEDEWINNGPDTLDELLADDSIQIEDINPDDIVIKRSEEHTSELQSH